MTILRKILILPLILLLPSCVAISTANMSPTETLAKDEGILLIRTFGEGVDAGKIHVHDLEAGGFSLSAVSLSIKTGEQILLLKIKAGPTYGLTRYATYGGGFELDKGKYTFTIEPGKINYVADISVEQHGYSARLGVAVDESITVAKAKQTAPKLFEKYPYTLSAVKIERD